MTYPSALSSEDLEKLKAFDRCTISNAIECLSGRLQSEAFPRAAAPESSSLVPLKKQVRVR